MLKQLNYDLALNGHISRPIPSFLIECLVYMVEDAYFLFEEDDRWVRLLRILYRIQALLQDDAAASEATEINEINYLFRNHQSWTLRQAREFVTVAIGRLEAV